jgi:uncharacterized protein YqgV (UPF0045/DUF77 family)
MANSTATQIKTANEVTKESTMNNEVNPAISTLESEGVALATMWKSMVSAESKRFNDNTKAEGFDTRLGKLMQQLKAEGGERISSDRLKACGIHTIDKRRRAEAMWFVENEVVAREFMKASKKGFGSLTALQSAMAKAAKADEPKATEGEVSAEANSEANDKSNVGPKLDAKGIADMLKALCASNEVSWEEVFILIDDEARAAKAVEVTTQLVAA